MQAGVEVLEDVHGEALRHARTALARRVRAHHDEIVEMIFTRVTGDAFPRTGDQNPQYLAGLHATVAAAVEYGLDGIEHGENWAGPIPQVTIEQARRAARLNVSLDTVLRRYILGHTLLGEYAMQAAHSYEPPGEQDVLPAVLRAQAAVLDRLLQAITHAYQQELALAARSPQQHLSEQVTALLDGDIPHQPPFDYKLDAWHLAIIATTTTAASTSAATSTSAGAASAGNALRALASRVDRRLLCVAHGQHTVWAWLGGTTRLTVADVQRAIRTTPATLTSVAVGVVFAVGEPAHGLDGWRLTHRQAQLALLVAQHRPQPLTRYGDVALLASALKDPALAQALTEIYLAPLDDARDRGPMLRDTLHAYLAAERNASSAASALKIARGTLSNRLRMIEERLGRTLNSCPAELEIALQLDKLTRVSPAE